VRVIVPFAPGGQSDTVMRLPQARMAEHLGVPVVVENCPGAGGAVGAVVAASSPPDGTTLVFDSFGFVVRPLVQRGLPFDYVTAFAPVAQVVAAPYVLVVKRDFPATDLAAFIAAARQRQGVPFGSPGIGTVGHLAGALLAHRASIMLDTLPIAEVRTRRVTSRRATLMPRSARPTACGRSRSTTARAASRRPVRNAAARWPSCRPLPKAASRAST
jgi:tripartite-type tricarboxylate transporter receptor subunit TctC